jgi:hypothetical protein
VATEELDIQAYKVTSPVPRYEWFLEIDKGQRTEE